MSFPDIHLEAVNRQALRDYLDCWSRRVAQMEETFGPEDE